MHTKAFAAFAALVSVLDDGSARSAALASRLGAPHVAGAAAEGWALAYVSADAPTLRLVQLDARGRSTTALGSGLLAAGRTAGSALVRAAKPQNRTVWDCTGGLGRDSLTLAEAGALSVRVFEREPVLLELLRAGLGELEIARPAVAARLRVTAGDAASAGGDGERPDVVYLDPMYPEEAKRKSASVKKDLAALRAIVPDAAPGDDARLLEAALALGAGRVVVKRPRTGPPLAGLAPSYVVGGGSGASRFDVYVGGGGGAAV